MRNQGGSLGLPSRKVDRNGNFVDEIYRSLQRQATNTHFPALGHLHDGSEQNATTWEEDKYGGESRDRDRGEVGEVPRGCKAEKKCPRTIPARLFAWIHGRQAGSRSGGDALGRELDSPPLGREEARRQVYQRLWLELEQARRETGEAGGEVDVPSAGESAIRMELQYDGEDDALKCIRGNFPGFVDGLGLGDGCNAATRVTEREKDETTSGSCMETRCKVISPKRPI